MNGDSPFLPTGQLQPSEKEEQSLNYDLHDYDIDVINNALSDAHQTEYHDHFGFKVQVKTDDEDSMDTSDDQDDSDSDDKQFDSGDANTPNETDRLSSTKTSNKEQQQGTGYDKQQNTTDTGQTHSNFKFTDERLANDEDEWSNSTHQQQDLGSNNHSQYTRLEEDVRCENVNDSHKYAPLDRQHPLTVDSCVPQSQQMNHTNTYSSCNLNSITSPTSPSRSNYTSIIRRPSQACQERKSKRGSALDYTISPVRSLFDLTSPPSSPSCLSNRRLSKSSGINSGMLTSKPSPKSSDIEQETEGQIKLRQDALELLEQERKAQPGEYDWDFWKSMIIDTDKVMTSQGPALQRHMSTGLPDRLRGSLWQLMAKSKNQEGDMESVYWELLQQTSLHEKLILHDLDTSFPMAKFFPFQTDTVDLDGNTKHSQQYQSLYNVLKAYSLFDQMVGYSQGLSFIVAVFLKQIPDEVAVFCLLVQVMGRYGLQGHLTESMDTLQLHLYQFEHLFQLTLPELHRHVDALGIKPNMYASRWFATSFAYHCSPSLAVRVLDLILVEGVYVMQRFTLALLKRNQSRMVELGFQELMKFFEVDVFDVYKGQRNEFVMDMYRIEIPPKLYSRLAKQYQHELARKMKSQSEIEEEARMVNDRLSIQLQEIQDKYKVLEIEHQEMTQQAVETKMAMAKTGSDNELLNHEIKQLQTRCEQMERQKDTEHQARLEDIYKSNSQLIQQNATLQDQLSDMESVLIDLKMKYAEQESEYQQLRGQLADAQKS